MLAADDPAATLAAHEAGTPVEVLDSLPRRWELALQDNHTLMNSLSLVATPGIVYRQDGLLKTAQGMPRDGRLNEILGPRP
jgi:thiol:disulfide interchange protein DsbG